MISIFGCNLVRFVFGYSYRLSKTWNAQEVIQIIIWNSSEYKLSVPNNWDASQYLQIFQHMSIKWYLGKTTILTKNLIQLKCDKCVGLRAGSMAFILLHYINLLNNINIDIKRYTMVHQPQMFYFKELFQTSLGES